VIVSGTDYEVLFQGTAGDTLRAAFDDCVVRTDNGITVVRCAAGMLEGVLDRVQSFGLVLLEVRSR
jgi:class 3 adenylate cyclase